MTGTKTFPGGPTSPTDIGRVLRFWHKVEFFIPFDLQQQVLDAQDKEWSVRGWTLDSLPNGPGDLWKFKVPQGRRLTGFDIYLGVFDKSALTEIVQDALSDEQAFDQDERGELEGLTCMAKVKAGLSGELLIDEVSVSMVPWALGRVRKKKLAGLDFDLFEESLDMVKIELQQFHAVHAAKAEPPKPESENEDEDEGEEKPAPNLPPPALTGDELKTLLELFQQWADFTPDMSDSKRPILVVRAKSVEDRRKENAASTVRETPATEEGDEDESDEAELEIDILNSFYAKDIARAIRSIDAGEGCPPLRAYLAPVPEESRMDLYTPKGRAHIRQSLGPGQVPTGHWPDEPAHAMSLMQQFAINNMLSRLENAGIFSVNGPPGTGKTTLLRDVFAELITRRARILARLSTPKDAFSGTRRVDFQDRDPCTIGILRPDLIGFEMVVASSNNAAVENLSRDLPKSKSLGKTEWRDEKGTAKVRYLQTVAHNMAAFAGKRGYRDLSGEDGRGDDIPWGLVAAALGKKANRSRFSSGVWQDGLKKKPPPKGFDPALHQSLWNWRFRTDHVSFAAARDAFGRADQAVKSRVEALKRHAALEERLRDQTRETFIAAAEKDLHQASRTLASLTAKEHRLSEEIALCAKQLAILSERERIAKASRPAWGTRWLRSEQEQAYRTELRAIREQQKIWLEREYTARGAKADIDPRLPAAREELARCETSLAKRQEDWLALQKEWQESSNAFPKVRFPADDGALEEDRWQIDGLWRDDVLNRLRSSLFAAALGLHEAWLAEVMPNGGGFGGNGMAISKMLSGTRPNNAQDALEIWRSLFLIVPVVSSTFASIASQFRDLGPESIGWLFIDEAGQAVPQAAVGALWRAKRAVVVGDPLQIEPVFTVPIKLIEALAKDAGLSPEAGVAPHMVSVQNLADEANGLGAMVPVGERMQWIGSPLRVHRRCVDPMFTIANAIAYRNKMIYFDPERPQSRLPPADTLDLGPSAWISLGGTAVNKQVVPDQVDFVVEAVQTLYRRTGKLPSLYVISPFRRIKQALIERLSDVKRWPSGQQPGAKDLKDWCRAQIGTVHTFQGKEESVVFMVLGCDRKSIGAARWAAGKPNLLNVALTRAKHRFFMIGDDALWGPLPNFSDAGSGLLPRIAPETFLERAEGPSDEQPPPSEE